MGYGYGRTASGGWALACDSCGATETVRKRPCVYKVLCSSQSGPRPSVPYCPAPALCSPCLKREGGIRGVHGDRCRDGAAAMQAGADTEQALIDSGALLRCAAWGSWAPGVPDGQVGVLFRSTAGEAAFLMPNAAYDAIPLGVPATPDDYRAFGELVPIDPEAITKEAA